MKKILFVYTKMIVGGSTTSLLAVLNNFDYTKYSVDLILHEKGGDLFTLIPKEVNILEQAHIYSNDSKKLLLKRICSPTYIKDYIKSRILSKKRKSPLIKQQIMSYQSAGFSRKYEGYYDVAIAFLEFWATIYVSKYVQAQKKITWIHIDYKGIRLIPSIDEECFSKFNKIVLVSNNCLTNFIGIFPQFQNKAICIENILSRKMLLDLSKEFKSELELDDSMINIVTVCRIVFSHKGLDRGVRAFKRIYDEGQVSKIKWYIIGDGQDYEALKAMINTNGLEKHIILLGKKMNPFPYVSGMDLFFLPSLYEGKPIAVTEAMILGIPPVVCNYASAGDQIENGVDGIILDNNEEAIFNGLKTIIENPKKIQPLKDVLRSRDYSNVDEMTKIYKIIEEGGY